jgi:MFS family permease
MATGTGKAWLVVALCMLAYVLSFVDRQILALMIEPIRADLALSDLEFGLLGGLAFALFYGVLGIPIASLADKRSRPAIIAIGIAVWSLTTAACGFARSFVQLFLNRMLVGAGEAALSPATYSLLADLFPKDRLGRAIAVYSTGSFVGAGAAFLAGGAVIGWVKAHHALLPLALQGFATWQIVFMIVGAPGLPLALLIWLVVGEPRRTATAAEAPPALSGVLRFLIAERRVLLTNILGFSFTAAAMYALLNWTPAYLIRAHGFDAPRAGLWLGIGVATACTAGVLASGWLVDFFARRGRGDSSFLTGIIGAAGTGVSILALPFAPTLGASMVPLLLSLFFMAFPMPPSTVLIQRACPPRMRSRMAAIFLFSNSLIGIAGGSAAVGALNDHVFSGPLATARSLALVVAVSSACAVLILASGLRPLRARLPLLVG